MNDWAKTADDFGRSLKTENSIWRHCVSRCFFFWKQIPNVRVEFPVPDVQSHTSIVCSPLLVSVADTVIKCFESELNFTTAIPIFTGGEIVRTGILRIWLMHVQNYLQYNFFLSPANYKFIVLRCALIQWLGNNSFMDSNYNRGN